MSSSTLIFNSREYARYIRRFLVLWLLVTLAPALVVLVVDPYQVIHKSLINNPPFYKDNERYQVAGLINNYLKNGNYDGVVIGSSLSSNFTSDILKKSFGWDALNLSMRGSTLAERSLVLQRALETKKINHVLFEINPVDIRDDDLDPETDALFPAYLYSNGLTSKWRYFFNQTTVLQSLAILFKDTAIESYYIKFTGKPLLEPNSWGYGIGQWASWIDAAETNKNFSNYNTRENMLASHVDLNAAKLKQQRESWIWRKDYPFGGAQKNLVDVVRNHPDVEFRIWFGPVSLLRYAGDINMDAINRHVELRRFVTNELATIPNVKIYSFDNDLDIVGDMKNYMDTSHFSREVMTAILSDMSHDSHRLYPQDIEVFTEKFRNNVLNFDIQVPAE